jgi:hypothetical protein
MHPTLLPMENQTAKPIKSGKYYGARILIASTVYVRYRLLQTDFVLAPGVPQIQQIVASE